MIISHKHKFLFIGLPFSASSAIIQDLYCKYEGLPYLRKHSLYHEFNNTASEKEKEYFKFAVLRNPMDIVVTSYEKMKANAKGNFTNPSLFKENGGHITKHQRKKFNFIKKYSPTFQQYFLKFYKQPYDNYSSLTLDKCDFIIRYENLDKDYLNTLKAIGIKNPSKLEVVNKTKGKKKDLLSYYTKDIQCRAVSVFGPFMEKYNYHFPREWDNIKVPKKSMIYFKVLSLLRKINELVIKKYSTRKSIKGTVYGDIQRIQKNN